MLNWLIIGVLLIVVLYVIRIQHFGKKVKVVAIVIIIALIYFSSTALLASNNIELNSVQGVGKAVYLYVGWTGNAAKTIWSAGGDIVTIIGNSIKGNPPEASFKGSLNR